MSKIGPFWRFFALFKIKKVVGFSWKLDFWNPRQILHRIGIQTKNLEHDNLSNRSRKIRDLTQYFQISAVAPLEEISSKRKKKAFPFELYFNIITKLIWFIKFKVPLHRRAFCQKSALFWRFFALFKIIKLSDSAEN